MLVEKWVHNEKRQQTNPIPIGLCFFTEKLDSIWRGMFIFGQTKAYLGIHLVLLEKEDLQLMQGIIHCFICSIN